MVAYGAELLPGVLPEGVSTALGYVGLGTGAFGFGWDLANTLVKTCVL